jgi:hypothetical protein
LKIEARRVAAGAAIVGKISIRADVIMTAPLLMAELPHEAA